MNRWLSIIVPTYNGTPYLSECLHSVLDQFPEDYELIVVDDGSKDDTKIILEGFAGRQSNLQVCFCSHKGVSGARNTGLSLASGRYVVFLDGDDHLRPGILETVRPQLEADADLTIFGIERVFPAADPSGKYHAADLRPCFDANASRAVYLAVLSADRVSDPHSEPSPVQRLAPKGCASLGQRPPDAVSHRRAGRSRRGLRCDPPIRAGARRIGADGKPRGPLHGGNGGLPHCTARRYRDPYADHGILRKGSHALYDARRRTLHRAGRAAGLPPPTIDNYQFIKRFAASVEYQYILNMNYTVIVVR